MKKTKSTFLFRIGFLIGVTALLISTPLVASASINSTLRLGSRGVEVGSLQAFLGVGPDGIFGPITRFAVIKYQSNNGLVADGIVGRITRAVINFQMIRGTSAEGAPVISGVSISSRRDSAVVTWSTNELAKGMVYYSSTPLSTYEHENSVDVSGATAMTDMNTHTSQSVAISNLQPNTTYYYLIYVTDQSGLVSVTWPISFVTTN